jgi:hypothetical protein
LHFQGAGYSTGFVKNFKALMEGVAAREQSWVRVAPLADDICGACPSLQDDGETCAYQASIMRRDRALLEPMGWQPGDVLDLEEAHKAVLAQRDTLMASVCTGCEWLPRCTANGPHGIASPLRRPVRTREEELR